MEFTSVVLVPQIYITPVWSWGKHPTNSSWGTFYKIADQRHSSKLLWSLKTRKVWKIATVKRRGDMATKCTMASWMGPCKSKRVLGKNKGNVNKAWILVNDNISVFVHLMWQMYHTNVIGYWDNGDGVYGNSVLFTIFATFLKIYNCSKIKKVYLK